MEKLSFAPSGKPWTTPSPAGQMSRLASFQGPSTPSKNPVNTSEYAPLSPSSKGKKSSKSRQNPRPASDQPPEPPSSPSTPTRKNRPAASSPVPITAHEQSFDFVESTVHKRLRQTLLEVRGVTKRWDELTKVDGFKAAKEIIDARTLIDSKREITVQGSGGTQHESHKRQHLEAGSDDLEP